MTTVDVERIADLVLPRDGRPYREDLQAAAGLVQTLVERAGVDALDIIAVAILPVDGPHPPERVRLAGVVIAELVRRLNHATQPHRVPGSLPDPGDVTGLVESLRSAVVGVEQLAGQVAARLGQLAEDPRLVHEEGQDANGDDAGMVAASAAGLLRQEVVHLTQLLAAHLYEVTARTRDLYLDGGADDGA